MKVNGSYTTYTKVEVSCSEMLESLRGELQRLYKLPGQYINRDGFWETDYGGHGSGYQEKRRAATEKEKELMSAWDVIEHAFRNPPKKEDKV